MSKRDSSLASYVTFFATPELVGDHDDDGPAGEGLADLIRESLSNAGFTTTVVENCEDYAWDFFASSGKSSWYIQVGFKDEVGSRTLMLTTLEHRGGCLLPTKPDLEIQKRILLALRGLFAVDDRLTDPRWFTDHQFVDLVEAEWMNEPFKGAN